MMPGSGFRGPECLDCGGVRSEVKESGYTADDQRIRRRVCRDCGQDAVSIEVYIDPGLTSFWKLNPGRRDMKRESDYRRRGKGVYRLPNRTSDPDRVAIAIAVSKGGPRPVTHCRRSHLRTPENTYVTPGNGYFDCAVCRRIRQQRRRVA